LAKIGCMTQQLPPPEAIAGFERICDAQARSRRPKATDRTPMYRVGICRGGFLPHAQAVLHGYPELTAFAAQMFDLGYAPIQVPDAHKLGCDLVYALDPEREFQSSRR
jgi:hypothetical protein